MNTNTTLLMFAVVAAFGLVMATLVLPVVPQASAARPPGKPPCGPKSNSEVPCEDFGRLHAPD
jgi:hypothetical protein